MHSTEGHDATLVPVYAMGPGAERFRGVIDNTDIAKGIRAVAGVAAPPPARSLPARLLRSLQTLPFRVRISRRQSREAPHYLVMRQGMERQHPVKPGTERNTSGG